MKKNRPQCAATFDNEQCSKLERHFGPHLSLGQEGWHSWSDQEKARVLAARRALEAAPACSGPGKGRKE
jgi:hypothetical protein